MKKTAIILITLAVIAGSCKTSISVVSQKKNIVGVWNFYKDHLLMEITETNMGKYGGDMSVEYKILNKKELLETKGDKEKIRKYKLQKDGNSLMLLEGKSHKHFAERIKIQPNKNLVGKYFYYDTDFDPDVSDVTNADYIDILDESNALVRNPFTGEAVSMKYIALEQNLFLISDGYYRQMKVDNDLLFFEMDSRLVFYKKVAEREQ